MRLFTARAADRAREELIALVAAWTRSGSKPSDPDRIPQQAAAYAAAIQRHRETIVAECVRNLAAEKAARREGGREIDADPR